MILFLESWCQIVQGQFKGFVLGSSEYKGGNWVTCLMIVSKWNLFCLLPPYRHNWHKTKTNVSTSLGACKLSAFCVAKDWLTIARWTLCPMQHVLVLVKLCKCSAFNAHCTCQSSSVDFGRTSRDGDEFSADAGNTLRLKQLKKLLVDVTQLSWASFYFVKCLF